MYWAAFVAGFVSFVTPCVLPLVPIYVSYLAADGAATWRRRMANATGFVLGFSGFFAITGAGFGLLGGLFAVNAATIRFVSGSVLLLLGILLAFSVFPVPLRGRFLFFARDWRLHPKRVARRATPAWAFVVGAIFALGWTPCVGPILGAILTLAANFGEPGTSAVLLAFYGAGLGIPFLLVAAFSGTGKLIRLPKMLARAGLWFSRLGALLLIAFAIGVLTNKIVAFGELFL